MHKRTLRVVLTILEESPYNTDMPQLLPGLRPARLRAGMTQEELAAAAKVSSATVFKHEQGKLGGISARTLEALSGALKVPTTTLFLPENSEGSI